MTFDEAARLLRDRVARMYRKGKLDPLLESVREANDGLDISRRKLGLRIEVVEYEDGRWRSTPIARALPASGGPTAAREAGIILAPLPGDACDPNLDPTRGLDLF
jgi:hypothetical protein